MNKLKQIEALVEEAFIKLGIVTRNTNEKKILIDFGRKCAEIDEEDWEDSSRTWIGDTIKTYNSRLLGDEKEELHPAIQHVNAEGELTPETAKAINKLAEVAYNTPIKPALQPLPEKMPAFIHDLFVDLLHNRLQPSAFYQAIRNTYGTQPREWWMDLKKGDKFMYGDGIDGEIRTFNGHYSCIEDNYFLYSMEEGDSIGIGVGNCTPYTDPEAQLRKTLNPDQIKLLDEMKANTTP